MAGDRRPSSMMNVRSARMVIMVSSMTPPRKWEYPPENVPRKGMHRRCGFPLQPPPKLHLPRGLTDGADSRPQQRIGSSFTECTPPALVLVLGVPSEALSTCNDQGVSHAEWPKDHHESTPIQTVSVICSRLDAVDAECRAPRAEGLSKPATTV
jgi:hypothetical protein